MASKHLRQYNRTLKDGKGVLHGAGWKGTAFGVGVGTAFNLSQGYGLGASIGLGILEDAAFSIAPAATMTLALAPVVPAAAKGLYNANKAVVNKYNSNLNTNSHFTYRDSQAAVTMRQAAVQAIQGSKLNARNALGGEASLMHRRYTGR